MTASIGTADQVMNIETVRFRRLVVFNKTIFILHRVAIRHEYHLSNPKVFFSLQFTKRLAQQCCMSQCSHQAVLYVQYSTAKSFDPPMQNTIDVYKYSVHIYLLCVIKVRVKWCSCSLWRML